MSRKGKMTRRISVIAAMLMILFVMTGCGTESVKNEKVTAEQVVSAIDSIGYVGGIKAVSKQSAVMNAENMYDQLSDNEKTAVTNYDKLTEARKEIDFRQKQITDAQAFAEKFFLRLAKQFKYPESISLQHVWYSDLYSKEDDPHMAYFTFQFDVKNGLGIVENVYYGNTMSFMEMTDDELSQFMSGFILTGGYIKEGATRAMDSELNIELNALQVMEYLKRTGKTVRKRQE